MISLRNSISYYLKSYKLRWQEVALITINKNIQYETGYRNYNIKYLTIEFILMQN